MNFNIKSVLFILMILCEILFPQNQIEYVSRVCANTPLNAILDTSSNYLYIIDVGLVVFDFSNPGNPILVNHLTPMEGMHIYEELIIIGDTGYADWGGGGIQRIDFSNPVNPTPTNYLLNNNLIYRNLVIKHPYLYAFARTQNNSSSYIQCIDITSGTILGSLNLNTGFLHNTFEAKKFIIDGNNLFLSMGPRGTIGETELHIFAISSPDSFSHQSSVSLGSSSAIAVILNSSHWDLAKKNNYIYVAAWFAHPESRIKIVDVANPLAPQVVKEWIDSAITGGSGDIKISGNNLFLTDLSGSFNVISITNDTSLSLCKRIGGFLPPYYLSNFFMQLFGDYAFLFYLDNYAAYTIDVSSPCNSTVIDTIPFAHDWKDIAAMDTNFVFTTVWNFYQMYSLDVSNVMNPFISQRTEVKGSGWGIDVKNNYAYLAMGMQNFTYPPGTKSGGLIIYDISDPNNPIEKGWSPPEYQNNDVQVFVNSQNNLAYVIAGQPNSEGESHDNHISQKPGLRIVDVSNPNSLIQLGKINITPQCRGIFQEGNYAYIAASSPDSSSIIDTSGLYIVDVSNPAYPFIAGKWVRTQLQKGHTRAVVVKNNYAYVAHSGYLEVLDVSNPTSPSLVKEIALGNTQTMDVAISGKYLFTITQQSLIVFDISNPANPTLIDKTSQIFFAPPRHFHIQPPYIYVISAAGVFIFKFDALVSAVENLTEKPLDFYLFQNYPNPFNPTTVISYQISAFNHVSLKVFDVLGREVAILVDEYKHPGIYNCEWRIENLELSSGVYIYRLQTGKFFMQRKMMVIK